MAGTPSQIQPQATQPLDYAQTRATFAWCPATHELRAQFAPVNQLTEVLYTSLGLLILLGLGGLPVLLIGWGLSTYSSEMTWFLSVVLGVPLFGVWVALMTQCILNLVRRIRHGRAPVVVQATPAALTIHSPGALTPPQRHWLNDQIRRIDVHAAGWDLALDRIVYLRVWSGDQYNLTEVRFSTRERDLVERLDEALHDALRLPRAGRGRLCLHTHCNDDRRDLPARTSRDQRSDRQLPQDVPPKTHPAQSPQTRRGGGSC